MEVQIEEAGELTREITVTLPGKDFSSRVEQELRKAQQTHKQRGFRPGKVPMELIKARFGAAIEGQILEELVNGTLEKALDGQENVVHVSRPEIVSKGHKGLQYRFKAERMPKVEARNYAGIAIEKAQVSDLDAELEGRLKEIRRRHSSVQLIERNQVQDGDTVKITYRNLRDGAADEGTEVEVDVGSGSFHKDLEAGLVGALVGEERQVTLGGGDDPLALSVVVSGVYERVLPEIDDALAVDEGYASLLDLRAKVREEVEQKYDRLAEGELREKILTRLVETNPFPLPQGYFSQVLMEELRRMLQPWLRSGYNPGMEEIRRLSDSIRPQVERVMRNSLVLGSIADQEKITVSEEEVAAKVEELSKDRRTRSEYADPQAREKVRVELRLEKAFQFVRDAASLTLVERSVEHFSPKKGEEAGEATEGGSEESAQG
jgi:trigger factor